MYGIALKPAVSKCVLFCQAQSCLSKNYYFVLLTLNCEILHLFDGLKQQQKTKKTL